MQNTYAEKWPIGHFSASLSKNRQKMAILGQKFDFRGLIAEKQEFSQIQANIPLIGHKKYYNLGEFEKNCWSRFFLNLQNAFFAKIQKMPILAKFSDENGHKMSKNGPEDTKFSENLPNTISYTAKTKNLKKVTFWGSKMAKNHYYRFRASGPTPHLRPPKRAIYRFFPDMTPTL